MQRQLNLRHEGKYFDLRAILGQLNQRYFRGRLRGYTVMWGRRRKYRPKDYFIFGTIQEHDRVIRIHPSLDQPFVPLWFLRYVLYHEMLHSALRRRGRRRYVLFDQEPKRAGEQERDQLRAPVFQDQSLHSCRAIRSPRSVAGMSPG